MEIIRAGYKLLAKPTPFIPISEEQALNPNPIQEVETEKTIIETSFWHALRRCAVHLLPSTVSLTILILNIKGYFIGADFSSLINSETINLLLLQIAAKIQELLVTASLATIIFHISRQELLFGDGLPLGLIGSGFLFSDFGYFLSKEFLGSLRYKTKNKWRKAGFLTVLVLAGLTAALAGPASATLLVPKSQNWQAGATSFYLNGNSENFWPIYLASDDKASQPYCHGQNATKYGVCPSGGFYSLWGHYGKSNSSTFKTANVARSYAKRLSGSSFYWSIDSPLSQVPPVYTLGNARVDENFYSYTFLTQPHAATTIMMQQITEDWWRALLSHTKHRSDQIDDRVAQTTVLSPLVQTRCSAPQNLSSNNIEIEFPTLSPDGWLWGAAKNLSVVTLNNTASDHIRFQWVHLPDQFGAATIGSIFESAWTADNASRIAIGCTIFSAYFNSTLFTDEYSFWSGWYPWNIDFSHRYPIYNNSAPQSGPNGRIAVNDTWLDLLTPPTPSDGPGFYSWKPSTIESIMINAGLQDTLSLNNASSLMQAWRNEDLTGSGKTTLLEAIICSVFVDGISRSGSDRVYNTTGSVEQWTLSDYNQKDDFSTRILEGKDALNPPDSAFGDVTRLKIHLSITGFAYQSSLAGQLAMVVLVVHIVFAMSHTIWTLWTKESSNSWDSVSELLALAQNSDPAIRILKNTSAGVDHLNTFSEKAKIRAIQTRGQQEFDHVKMVFFREDNEKRKHCHQLIDGMNNQLTETRGIYSSDQNHVSELPEDDDLHFNDQHHYPSTWPMNQATNSSSTIGVPEPRLLRRQNSTVSLISHAKLGSALDNTREIEKDQRYG